MTTDLKKIAMTALIYFVVVSAFTVFSVMAELTIPEMLGLGVLEIVSLVGGNMVKSISDEEIIVKSISDSESE